MAKVIAEFNIDKYKVLKLDGAKPIGRYTKYIVGGEVHNIVPLYDAVDCIAIQSASSFIGKTVEFR